LITSINRSRAHGLRPWRTIHRRKCRSGMILNLEPVAKLHRRAELSAWGWIVRCPRTHSVGCFHHESLNRIGPGNASTRHFIKYLGAHSSQSFPLTHGGGRPPRDWAGLARSAVRTTQVKIALTLGIIVAFLSRPLIARMCRRLRHVDYHGWQDSPRDHAKPVH
jgi:hypothetical protein